MSQTILYLHGFASSAGGAKAQYLGERFEALPDVDFVPFDFNPTPKDFEYMTVTGLINRLRQHVLYRSVGPFCTVASSMGALVALHYAHRFDGVEKVLLLAPALSYIPADLNETDIRRWKNSGVIQVPHHAFERMLPLRVDLHLDGQRYRRPVPPAAPTLIIHGRDDETVPIENSRAYATAFPERVRLIEVEAGHRLNDQLSLIWEYVCSFLLA